MIQLSDIAEIQNISKPSYVAPDTSFIISYDGVNKSQEQQNLYGYISDINTQQQIPNSYWQKTIPTNHLFTSAVNIPGTDQDFNGEITLGHIPDMGVGTGVIITVVAIITATAAYYYIKKKK